MGKLYDSRQIEYAYVNNIVVLPNVSIPAVPAVYEDDVEITPAIPEKWKTRITLTYDLLTAERNQINVKAIEHWVVTDTKLTVPETITLIKDNLRTFVSADKLELSGYTEA